MIDKLKSNMLSIEMPDAAKARLQSACRTAAMRRTGRSFRPRAAFALAVLMALCAPMAAVPGMAASNAGYQVLYAISPALAQRLKPVQVSCEDNGIRMEVAAADIQGEEITVQVSVTDLEGGRLDDSIDLFDSYRINTPFDCDATCSQLSFDAQTQTAVFLIRITQRIDQGDRAAPAGSKLTFSLERMLTGKQEYEGAIEGIDLADVKLTNEVQDVSERLRGGDQEAKAAADDAGGYFALNGAEALLEPTEGVWVEAIGFFDGLLHIQTRYQDIFRTDNHGYMWLVNRASGTPIPAMYAFSFFDESGKDAIVEQVFPAEENELAEYSLYGRFVTCDTLIEGNWEVTFALPDGTTDD